MDGKLRFSLNLPPGYHFAPSGDELIVHYLRRKLDGLPPHLPIFNDVTPITDYRPEQITDEFRDFGEGARWYFFTKRTRKYATGSRPDRTTPGNGFWKATGPVREIPICPGGKLVGRARTLVFYTGPEKPTHWTMYEYENRTSEAEGNDKNVDKLGEWVLCTIQKSQRCDQKKEAGGKAKSKAGGKKRKGKARNGADLVQIQSAEVPEIAWPEKVDEAYVFDDLEQTGCPKKRPQIEQHEPPRSETMMVDDYDYNGIQYIWDDEYMPPPPLPLPLPLEYEVAPHVAGVGYSYNNMMYQPANSYLHAAHYAVEQDGYAGGHLGSLLGTGNIPCAYRPQHSCAAGTTNLPWSRGATTSGQVEP
uniref:NAC domain-containing protein n=1 Tax=Triticum urartu TaxID=4572 RepID=A0A8R7PK21_TRIUA